MPDEPHYEEARQIWNGMIDRRPGMIVRCADKQDVPHAIRFARDHGMELSILGGGHHIAGNSLSEGGLVIDFSDMKTVRVDTEKRRAYAEPGATLADFDKATQEYGLATPTGINSTTGLAGLTLGGGFGWLTRKYGMTVDNLLSATIITADGTARKASETENSDLFWAIRGGGGNFGVVTEFEYNLHPVGPEVLTGLLVFPLVEAKNIQKKYREFVKAMPLELNIWMVMRQAPPLPFLPEEVHGQPVVVLALFYDGDISKGQKQVEKIRSFGKSYGEHVGIQDYTAWQQAFDPLLTPGARNYWKSHNFIELEDGVFDTMIQYVEQLPSPHCEIFIGLVEGVANSVAPDAMAYRYRDTRFVMNVHGRWEKPEEDKKCIGWARDFFKASAPYASAGAYVNFMTEDESERIASAYGPNYDRLVKIKSKYDPDNIFHMNQNIKPQLLAK
jgi:FAD/FMN-containing dehydrogenase